MKHTLRLAVFALSLGAVMAATAAPQVSSPPASTASMGKADRTAPDPQQQIARLTKQLDLSPDQVAKITPILQDRQQRVAALRSDASLKPADRKAQMLALMESSGSQLNAVLTPDQRQKFAQWKQDAKQRRQDAKAGNAPSKAGGN
ncbi:MAG TPA: hypothetical protein VGO76_12195 [Luteibacter sp.]|jgi:protein CpxP|nr:hypothetical protein [Luteibacter sp.]